MSKENSEKIKADVLAKFPNAVVSHHAEYGDQTIVLKRESLLEVCAFLKANPENPMNMLLDVCGVDYLGQTPRFEVVYHIYSVVTHARLRLIVKLEESDLKIASVRKVWEAANWFEREACEMYGIVFEGHGNLKKLLLWEAFEGNPLRKDYPMGKRQPIPEPLDIV